MHKIMDNFNIEHHFMAVIPVSNSKNPRNKKLQNHIHTIKIKNKIQKFLTISKI